MKNKEIIDALNWRYATKIFDSNKKVSDDDIHTILEAARLSPSSIGAEMWKFVLVEDKETRSKLREAGYGQPQITDASRLIIVTYRTDSKENMTKEKIDRTSKIQNEDPSNLSGLKTMLDGAIAQKIADGSLESWVKTQAYIPLGIMLETAALLGIDSCPMEGFSPEKFDEILNLKDKNLKSAIILAVGYRGDDATSLRPKVRRAYDEVVEVI